MRKFKIIGLLVAVCALSAVATSSAMAAESALTPGANPAIIEGTQATTQKLILTGGTGTAVTVKCTTSTLTATTTGTKVIEATATPAYAGCTLAGLNAEIKTNSCTYTITNTATALIANADLTNCPSTAPIEIKVPSTGCVVKIETQGPLSKITFANNGGTPATVTATLGITGIKFTGNSSCPANIVGTFTNGDLEGSYTLKAFKDVEGKKGEQVALNAD